MAHEQNCALKINSQYPCTCGRLPITIPQVPEDAKVPFPLTNEQLAEMYKDVPANGCVMKEDGTIGYTTKDSGQRERFSSGMVRDTQADKTQYDLVFDGPMLKRWAELLTRGAAKYEARNWMKANGQEELNRFKASAVRHFFQYMAGDTEEDHAAAVIFNLNGYEYLKGKLNENKD